MKRTAEETLRDYKEKLGEEFGETYYYTKSDWYGLWLLWRQYENLFVIGGKERIKLLNDSGSEFFSMVQSRFFEATLLGLCKLSDQSKIFGKKTLTVRNFYKHMDSRNRKRRMQDLIDEVIEKTEFARDWRNNAISHTNYEHRTNPKIKLEKASVDKVSEAMSAFHKIFEYIASEFMDISIADYVRTGTNTEIETLKMLFFGNQAWEEMLEKSKQGIEPPRSAPDWVTKSRN